MSADHASQSEHQPVVRGIILGKSTEQEECGASNASASAHNSVSSRFDRWRKPLLAFFLGQPAVQFLNLITGFILIRWLDVNEFAMFGIVVAFQATISQLVDLGFSGSITALAGERGHDPDVLGGYLHSARYWRSKMQNVVLVIAAILFPFVTWAQPWESPTKCLLFGAVALGVFLQGWSLYGVPLLVHRQLHEFYRPQIKAALLRLVLTAGLYATGVLNAWLSASLAALALGCTGWDYRRASRIYVHEPAESQPARNAEMLRYLAPLIPGVAFTALQGQILIGISSIFGTARNIAEVSALGRIGQLFLVLAAFNSVLVGPYIAGVSRSMLARRYTQILGAAVLVSGVICVFGFLMPQPLLWLLGRNYAGLQSEIGWVVLTGCLSYLGGVIYTMHAARRWIYWWSPIAYIPIITLTQAWCIWAWDLSKTQSVILFGLITAAVSLAVQSSVGVYGFVATARHCKV